MKPHVKGNKPKHAERCTSRDVCPRSCFCLTSAAQTHGGFQQCANRTPACHETFLRNTIVGLIASGQMALDWLNKLRLLSFQYHQHRIGLQVNSSPGGYVQRQFSLRAIFCLRECADVCAHNIARECRDVVPRQPCLQIITNVVISQVPNAFIVREVV